LGINHYKHTQKEGAEGGVQDILMLYACSCRDVMNVLVLRTAKTAKSCDLLQLALFLVLPLATEMSKGLPLAFFQLKIFTQACMEQR